jgi:hypothetical protein
MIIVCSMFSHRKNIEHYSHDTQTIYKKIIFNVITKYVGFKPYA